MRKNKILLGDNPFFGIDHLSQERARNRLKVLTNFGKITEVIEHVTKLGVKGFVVSTHPNLQLLISHMEKNTDLLNKLEFYPIFPYAQGYVAKVTEKGAVGAINDILSGISTKNKIKMLIRGSMSYLTKDINKIIQVFTDLELYSVRNVKINTVFLHDVITDLIIGLDLKEVLETYVTYVTDHHHVKIGLVTKNFPLLIKKLNEWNIVAVSSIMTSFNPIGYQMNPSKSECENSLKQYSNVIAMNTLAGGFVNPHVAADYISKINIQASVIGMSTKEHATETINAFMGKNMYEKI